MGKFGGLTVALVHKATVTAVIIVNRSPGAYRMEANLDG